ncbi:hypothetical protein [Catellatospora methionotrophica]|uniref:hypothetical protein n=1 Tax=Catellatospora methionotrophica TaxID=121620 RepID=UPI0034080415
MRRAVMASVVMVAALLAGAVPAQAAAQTGGHGGWVPAPSAAFEQPAGARCDFAIRSEPIRDEVRQLVLETNADGTPKRVVYAGDLIVKFTNLATGVSAEVDASGTALVDYHTDGSMTWYVVGPVIFGFRDDGSTLPRGMWLIDGVYTLAFSPTFQKTLTMVHGTTTNLCTLVD